ncbi:hypothetical protein MMC21_000960 [Puttea exsequens]|nr:hypothetical protein [Puttea exsequens]
MLFAGHSRAQSEEDVRQTTWKEVIHKADVRLMRVPIDALYMLPGMQDQTGGASRPSNGEGQNDEYFPPQMSGSARSDEYAYQLVIVEDLDDDRVHSFEQDEPQPGPYGDVNLAGIREALPIHELSKIFYADTGKILNIGSEGEANSPILLLKRDPHSVPPRRMMDRHGEPDEGSGSSEGDGVSHSDETNGQDEVGYLTALSNIDRSDSRESTLAKQLAHAPDPWRLPPNLDPEWMAFEVFTEAEDSDDESEAEIASARPSRPSRSPSVDPAMLSALSRLSVQTPHSTSPSSQTRTPQSQQQLQPQLPPIRTSLSLLETLLRLLSLQQFQQAPHLSIPDELLTFFLSESASTGAASNDLQERKRIREETKRTVGFDPYDESPIKRRGEEYQYRGGESTSSQWDDSRERYGTPLKYGSPRYDDEGYDTHRMSNRSHSAHGQQTPHTPPLALKNLSKSSTPETPSISNVRRAPARRWTDGYGGLGQGAGDAGKKGSPLARPGTGITDEGIGTSPASINEETMS